MKVSDSNPILHFVPFLSTPFELSLNPILLFTLFLSKLQFFSCFEFFFREGVRICLDTNTFARSIVMLS